MADVASVKVAVRVRPLTSQEMNEGCTDAVLCQQEQNMIEFGYDKDGKDRKQFSYDHVFGQTKGNADIYNTCVAPLLAKALDGYNVTVFAYGQTGSGKTFTMMEGFADAAAGLETEIMGVAPRLMRDLFSSLPPRAESKEAEKTAANWNVKVSCLEIYNEEVYDLLSKDGDKKSKNVIIREDDRGEQILAGLHTEPVYSTLQMTEFLQKGMGARKTGSTGMNHRSSRSHAVFTIYIEQLFDKNKTEEDMGEGSGAGSGQVESLGRRFSKIQLVDLAGSERAKRTGAHGQQLKEGANINKSLLALGNVIEALARMEDIAGEETGGKSLAKMHIPYRDSKLTHLLKSSLGGNAYTLMIACASPADSNIEETLSTLRYAARARSIKNKAVLNVDPMIKQLSAMRVEVQQLRDQLNAARAGLPIDGTFASSSSSTETVRVPLGELKTVNINGYPGHGAPCPCGRTLEIGCNGSSSTTELAKLRAEVQHWQDESKRQEARAKLYRDKANYADIDRDAAIAQLENMAKACRDTVLPSVDGTSAQAPSLFAVESIKLALQEAEASLVTVRANAIASDIQNGEEEPEWDSLVNIDDLVVDGVSTVATSISSTSFGSGAGSYDGVGAGSKPTSAASRGGKEFDWSNEVDLGGLDRNYGSAAAAAPPKSLSAVPPIRPGGTASMQPSRLQAPASEAATRAKQTAAALQSHVDNQRKEIEKVNKKIAETSSLIEAMKGSAAAPADKAALDKAQLELSVLQSKLAAAMREKDALEAKLNQLQEAIRGEKLLNSARVQELTAQLEGVRTQLHEKVYQVSSLREKESEAKKLLKLRNESETKRVQLQLELDDLKKNKASLTRALKSQSDAQRAEIKKYQALTQQAQQQVNKLAKAKNEAQSLHDQKDTVLKRHIEEKLRLQAKLREQNVEITKLRTNARMAQGLAARSLPDSDDFNLSSHLDLNHTGQHSFLLNPVDAPVSPSEFYFTMAAGDAATHANNKGGYSKGLIDMVDQLVRNKKLTPEYLGVSDDTDAVGADDVHPADAAAEEDAALAAAAQALGGDRRFPFDTMLALAECFHGVPCPSSVRAYLEGEVAVQVAYRRTASLIQRLGKERAALASKKADAVANGASAVEIEQFERQHARYNVSIKQANDLLQTLEGQVNSDKSDGGAGTKASGRGAARVKPWRAALRDTTEAGNAIQFLLTSFAVLGQALETSMGAICSERAKGDQRVQEVLQQASQDIENMRKWQHSLQNATNELTILRSQQVKEIASTFSSSAAAQEANEQVGKLEKDFEIFKAVKVSQLETEIRVLSEELTVAKKEAAAAKLQLEADKKGKSKSKGPVLDAEIDRIVQARVDTAFTDPFPAPRASSGGGRAAAKRKAEDMAEDEIDDEAADDGDDEEDDNDESYSDEDARIVGKKHKRGKNSLPAAERRGSKKAATSSGGDADDDDSVPDGRVKASRQSKPMGDTCKCSGTAKGKSCKNCACQKAGRKCGDSCKCGDACANPHGSHKHADEPSNSELDRAVAEAEAEERAKAEEEAQMTLSSTLGTEVQQLQHDTASDDIRPEDAAAPAEAAPSAPTTMPPPAVPPQSARGPGNMAPPPLPFKPTVPSSAGVGPKTSINAKYGATGTGSHASSARASFGGGAIRSSVTSNIARPSLGGAGTQRSHPQMGRPALQAVSVNVLPTLGAKGPMPSTRPASSSVHSSSRSNGETAKSLLQPELRAAPSLGPAPARAPSSIFPPPH